MPGRTCEQVGVELVSLRHEIDLLELKFSMLAAEFAATDEADAEGFDSAISWIKANCRMSGGAAADRVCTGEELHRIPQSVLALVGGDIGFAYLCLIARTSAALEGRINEQSLLVQRASLAWPASATNAFTRGMRRTLKATRQNRRRVWTLAR